MQTRLIRFVCATLGVAALGSPVPAQGTTDFVESSAALNVSFEHRPGPATLGMSGGVAWIDFDADGDEDLLCASGDGEHLLLQNDAGTTFVDVTPGSGLLGTTLQTMGVICADYDQDGFPDAYLTANGPNALFHNRTDGSFEEVAAATQTAGQEWSSSASWADFDLDGDLDLYVGNYIAVLRFPYHVGAPNKLYLNQEGPGGAPLFQEVAASLGVDGSGVFGPLRDPSLQQFAGPPPIGEPTAGCTLSVATSDYDEDGDPDLMIGNDFGAWVMADELYQNALGPTGLQFSDVSVASGFDQRPLYNMGINGADYDHDGDWDYYLSNLGDNVLLRQEDGFFQDVVYSAGPVEGENDAGTLLLTSWGTVWGDFDNDAWEDLFVVNGFIPAANFIENDPISPNHLWMNARDGTFVRRDPALSGVDDPDVGRGVAVNDVNGDGWLDFVVLNNGAFSGLTPSRVFLNELAATNPQNGWLALRLVGRQSNREAIGARIEALVGTETLKRELLADPVYLSSGSRRIHFGLGTAQRADVVIRWPSGIEQGLPGLVGEKSHTVLEPRVTIASVDGPEKTSAGLRVKVHLRNHDTSAHRYSVVARGSRSGLPIAGTVATGVLGPEAETTVSIVAPRTPRTLRVFAAGALDGVRLKGPRVAGIGAPPTDAGGR